MRDVLVVLASTVSGAVAGWFASVVQYRQRRQLRQDDSAEASLGSTSAALGDLRAEYLKRATGGRPRRPGNGRMASLEAMLDAAVNLTADEKLVCLVQAYKTVGRAHASRDPDTGVQDEETSYSAVATHVRQRLRQAREV